MKRLVLILLAACGSSSPNTPPPSSPPPANVEPTPGSAQEPGPAATSPKLGEPCAEGDACGGKASCVSYYGIAGPRGPEFKSCEIKCKADGDCPDKHRCVTVADGPGQVCRPIE